jgi:hypothetical protein
METFLTPEIVPNGKSEVEGITMGISLQTAPLQDPLRVFGAMAAPGGGFLSVL